MFSSIKHRAARLLPAGLRQRVRRWYHPRVVAAFTPDRWPPSAGVQRLVREGDVVVDAGANVGYVTALLARWVGPRGRVHSFEPVPQTADLLRRAVRRLALRQVEVHACCVSDRAVLASMNIPNYAEGGENLYESRVVAEGEASAGGRVVQIPLVCLDDELAADRARVRFIKLDVEGHEEAALHGARALLQEARPALLIEIMGSLDAEGTSAHRVAAWLAGLGYAPYFWEGGWRPRRSGEKAVDYFFLAAHHVEQRHE